MPDGMLAPRRAEARLSFARAAGRTVLVGQQVSYPFHVTRALRVTPTAELAALYLQSAAGGVYAGDDLALSVAVGEGAAAHVTTQSATVVHHARGVPARLATAATVAAGGFLALLPDPLVLFPGADLTSETVLTLADGATALAAETVGLHDPAGEGRPFCRFEGALTVCNAAGRVLFADRGTVTGTALTGPAVLGAWRAWGLLLVIGPPDRLPNPVSLEAAAEAAGCLAGASAAPGGIGLAVRLVGPDGGTLGRCMAALARTAAEALGGWRLLARGK